MHAQAQVRRILLATGFGHISSVTAPVACMMAKRHAAELFVLHVVPMPMPAMSTSITAASVPEYTDPDLPARMDILVEEATRRVHEFVQASIVPHGCEATPAAAIGIAWDEIVNYAVEQKIDLIIMGTRRHGMLRRLLLGSVSKAVIEHAPCPVMLIPVDDDRSGSTKDKAA